MPRYVFRYSRSTLLIGRRVSLLSEPLSEECVPRQVKAMRCSDTKEQCGWRFGGSFIIKSSFQIPCFSALCSLPTPPRRLHRNPIFIFSWWESNAPPADPPLSFQVTSERPHVILVSLNHITFLHTLPSPLVFLLNNSRIPSFSPNFASIHVSPPPCVLFGGCQREVWLRIKLRW